MGYEQVDSVVIDGRTVRVGEILSCCCPYEIVNLHLRWNSDTKRVIADCPANGFSYRLTYSVDCPVHFPSALKAASP